MKPEYDQDELVRPVKSKGEITFLNRFYYIGQAFADLASCNPQCVTLIPGHLLPLTPVYTRWAVRLDRRVLKRSKEATGPRVFAVVLSDIYSSRFRNSSGVFPERFLTHEVK
jgi:hypothetical protein